MIHSLVVAIHRVQFDPTALQGLAALRDSPPGVKPYYPYSTLIRCVVSLTLPPFSSGASPAKLVLYGAYIPTLILSSSISYAIKGAPGQRLLLEDIYYAIGKQRLRQSPSGGI